MRRGPKARTTKQNARMDRAQELIEEVGQKIEAQRSRDLELLRARSSRLSKTILEFHDVALGVEERTLIENFNLICVRGERWGIIGDNGAGKTTLLRAILGEHPLQSGAIKRGLRTKFALFDQHKTMLQNAAGPIKLDDDSTLGDVLTEGGDYVAIGEERVHVASYLERYLFRGEDRMRKVGTLSGGEKARLLFARMFRDDANVLLLDEPTNDLDVTTLGVLEEMLVDHTGVVFIVSHDHHFLDRVCTGILSFEKDEKGRDTVVAYQGDYSHFLSRQLDAAKTPEPAVKKSVPKKKVASKKNKRSYKAQREYDGIEERVLFAEDKKSGIEAELARPEVASDAARLGELTTQLAEVQSEIDSLYARWQELEEMVK